MKTPAIRPVPALKTLIALTLIAALAALILYAALPVGATTHWVDYDSDDDGLIDIKTIAHLQAIRWDHDGNGALRSDHLGGSDGANYRAAFPDGNVIAHTAGDTSTRMGCPAACRGYELMNDLDFVNATTSQRNWTPPAAAYQYVGEFEGNGYTISNMIVNAPGGGYGGLFSILHTGGEIRNLGLIDPTVNAGSNGGALTGINRGTIIASYVSGGSVNTDRTTSVSGGLVGNNIGAIIAGYSTAAVTHSGSIISYHGGGLAGSNSASGRIIASYAAGPVSTYTGSNIGGLVGAQSGSVTDSYCSDATGQSGCLTAAAMQAPTAYTGIYANWNVDLGNIDADNFPDNPWNFGATTTYPTLKTPAQRQAVEDYDTDGDNLIEINNLHQLNAIRYDLNGDGLPAAAGNYAAYAGAFPGGDLATTTTSTTTPRMGCPDGCTGYELSQNLDFAADEMAVTSTDLYPNWTPIGTYAATFDGNGNTIAHLTITGGTGNYGLFSTLSSDGVIRDVGMVDAALSGGGIAGALVGQNDGTVATSYAQGGSITTNLMRLGYVGGLVGYNQGADAIIRASWSTASVTSDTNMENGAGGLVGVNQGGTITAGFGAGQAAGYRPASLVSWVDGGTVTGACDLTINTAGTCIGELTQNPTINAPGATTAQLQALTGYTGVFANLNADLDGDTFPDYPWKFDTATTTYPTLYTPTGRQAAAARVVDYDQDDDNLIDITNLHQLNAIRYDLNGNGLPDNAAHYSAYTGGFPNGNIADTSTPYLGCQSTCIGYELRMDLNFDTDGDGQVGVTTTSTDPYPNWQPITVGNTGYSAIFEGNGRTIARLTLDRSNLDAGLFGELEGGTIRNIGMIDAKIRSGGNRGHGILVGYSNRGTVAASYAQGGSLTITAPSGHAGGLVGRNVGAVRYSYSTAAVNGGAHNNLNIGGLVGLLSHTSGADAVITASYAAGATTYTYSGPFPGRVGGLVGQVQYAASRVADSHCDTQATGQSNCIGGLDFSATAAAAGYTTAQLQTPAGYTGPYANWNLDLDSDTFPDYPWNFGTTSQYPTLKTPEQRQIAAPAVDYDQDNDNLIDITNLHQLNAIRYDLDGNGLPDNAAHYSAYTGGFPNGNIADTSTPYLGCQSTCIGYELTENLNFDMDGDGRVGGATTSTDPYPNWTPIGPSPGYAAVFDGNGRTISRLTITGNVRAGLFDTLAAAGVIRDIGIIAPSVRAAPPIGQYIGVLTASNGGTITASYVQGGSVTVTNAYTYAGGLTGGNSGTIRASYATASVTKTDVNSNVGGLAGFSSGEIIASYAAGPVAGPGPATRVGAFVGTLSSPAAAITDSNCDTSVHATPRPCVAVHISGANSGVTAAGYTAAELQAPTGYTDMYRNWNLDLDGDTFPDYPWNFGTTSTYPTLYTPTQRQTAAAQVVDYDLDDDNLIDITNLHQLNALRYDPDGNGLPDNPAHYSAYSGGYPNGNIADTSTPYLGCAATCIGYELMVADLDFDTDGDNDVDSDDAYPNWTPIASYESTLEGNGYTISHPTVAASGNAGLFAALGADAVIRDLGIIDADITSSGASAKAGVLAAANAGQISASYAQSGRVTITGATPVAGGLIGENTGEILAVWSTAAVNASTTGAGFGGGLIGRHSGSLSVSYAAGRVSGSATSTAGGLIGDASAAVTASYCDTQATRQDDCIGRADPATITAAGHPTAALQTPTGYTGIYESWNIDLDGDGNNDYPWNFGEATQYPTLNTPTERQARIEAGEDTLPPPLPRTIPPEPERGYDPAADHPEIYANAEYGMAATCRTHDVDPETGNPRAATVTFDLGSYTGPILLHLSIWANGRYMAYETQGIALPTLERDGQRATLRVDTDPAQTRFRLDGRRNGLAANLVLGYANCHNDES